MLSSKAERDIGMVLDDETLKRDRNNLHEICKNMMKSSSIDIRLHWSFFLNQHLPDWKLWTPGEWLPRRPWSILTFKRRRDLSKDFLITLDWPVPREPSGLPWILAIWIYMNLMQKQSEVEGLTYLGCCPPIWLAVWSFLKDFYLSEVHFGFKASETSLFY